MDVLKLVITSLASIVVLFLMTKLMGEKQISQMSLLDYITGITIGSIAAEMATELETPWRPLVAMLVYGVATYLISIITSKSVGARKIITGRSIILFENGVLYRENLKKARLDISDFLTLCRVSGYFDLSQLQTAILEHNGNISFLPKSGERPLTPNDMQVQVEQQQLASSFILDGKILYDNLQKAGYDSKWLEKLYKEQGYKNPTDIFYAAWNGKDLSIYPIISKKFPSDRFE